MKRITLVICLLILASLPIVNADQKIISMQNSLVIECPVENKVMFGVTHYSSFVNHTFDNATVDYLNMTIVSTQSAKLNIYAMEYGTGFNYSWNPIISTTVDGVASFNASDFQLDSWIGYPQNNTWTSYYNRTHYAKTTHFYLTLPYFLIEFFNTGTYDAFITVFFERNITLHNYRVYDEVELIPHDDFFNYTNPTSTDDTTYHWWGDYWPTTGNPFVDAFFHLWLKDQDYGDNEYFMFYYDPTRFYSSIFEKGIALGFIGGIVLAGVVALIGKRFIA